MSDKAEIHRFGFPTRMGVNRISDCPDDGNLGLPHAGGGEPHGWASTTYRTMASPRGWG